MALASIDVEIIAHVVQLAVAPVFLLTGVAALLSVMTTRLGRVMDRARLIEGRWYQADNDERESVQLELALLEQRARLSSWAINFCASAALMVCLVIVMLFADAFLSKNLAWLVGGLFIATMLALMSGLITFLREVYLATHTLRIGPPLKRDAASSRTAN